MKREILFRGYSEALNKWVEGDLVHDAFDGTSMTMPVGIAPKNSYPFPVHPDSVGQFTGEVDINGVKAFEGHCDKDGNAIVFCQHCNGWQFSQFDFESGETVIPCHSCDGNFMFQDHIKNFEITGNTFKPNKP
jgi:hypothetical protein